MFKTIVNAFKIPDLRRKMLFVLMIILLYRLGAVMPVPFVDANVLAENFSASNGSFFQYLNIMSGEAFSRATIVCTVYSTVYHCTDCNAASYYRNSRS